MDLSDAVKCDLGLIKLHRTYSIRIPQNSRILTGWSKILYTAAALSLRVNTGKARSALVKDIAKELNSIFEGGDKAVDFFVGVVKI